MIKSVVCSYTWTPQQAAELYCDSQDYLGLEFWYDDIDEQIKSQTPST